MNEENNMGKNRAAGFSLIELMISILILMVIMGAVFSQIDLVQKRYRAEETKLDVFQTAREFIDQMVRDLHQAGFPNGKMLAGNTGHDPATIGNAVGIYYITDTEVDFQGDVDGDGVVDSIAYKLFPASSNAGDENCPCIRRSQLQKAADANPTDQIPDFRTQVENIQIVTDPVTKTTQPIFVAYDKFGVPQALGATGLTKWNFDPTDDGSSPGSDPINKIWAVQINLNVEAATADLQTKGKPHVFLTATAQVNN